MPADPRSVGGRLAALEEYLRFLSVMATLDRDAFCNDPRNYGAAERFLQLAIEAVFDIGSHCLSAKGIARPGSYAEILPAMAASAIISSETSGKLTSISGFRNLLVHEYMAVDRGRVHEYINTKLDGLHSFAGEIAAYLKL